MRNIWRSQRLVFRPVEPSDEPFLASINSYGSDSFQNATHYLPVPQGNASATRYRGFLEAALLGCIVCISRPRLDEVATSETIPVGTLALLASDPGKSHHRNTSIAVSIVTPYQGKGYGSEAILWALEWAFRHANLHRVGIGAHEWNEGAVKLYQRLGFVVEGRIREATWYDGRYRDEIEMGMLREEWERLYGKKASEQSSDAVEKQMRCGLTCETSDEN